MVDYPAMACGGPTMESKWNGESFFSMKTGFFNLIFNPRIKCVMLTPDEKMFHGLLGGVLSKYFPNSNHRILHWYPLNQDPQRDDVPYVDTPKIESSLN